MIAGEMDHPVTIETFTIREAAAAFGRSEASIRRWLAADKIPAPYITETEHRYRVYSVGELEVMARVIADHEREFNYLVSDHTQIVERMHQAVHAFRSEHL